jgi:hypothetical protein
MYGITLCYHQQIKSQIIIVHLTSINLQKKILKNPVFKSTNFLIDLY